MPEIDLSQDPREMHEITLLDMLSALGVRWKLLFGGALTFGLMTFGLASLISPTFIARTSLLPPQQQQGNAAIALSQLGALAGLAGNASSLKTPTDQYIGLMQSVTMSNRIIEQFKLMDVYQAKLRVDARRALEGAVAISASKKDGFITIEVEDRDPQRAADIANAYVQHLRDLTTTLAVTEAQQRRNFFEQQLQLTKDKLVQAQIALQSSGFNDGALKAEPRAAAEGYARLRAEMTSAEVRLQTMRRALANDAPEVVQQQAMLGALRQQVSRAEQRESPRGDSDYVSRYREFKYQETLFEVFARQYEQARLDESREGTLIQVVDPAVPPERKSKPKRGVMAVVGTLLAGVALAGYILLRRYGKALGSRELPSA